MPDHLSVLSGGIGFDRDRDEPAAGPGGRVQRNWSVPLQVLAESSYGTAGESFGDLPGLGVAVQHGVTHFVDRTRTDRVVGSVADDLEPRLVEQLAGPCLGWEEQRRQRLGEPFEAAFGRRRGATHVERGSTPLP